MSLTTDTAFSNIFLLVQKTNIGTKVAIGLALLLGLVKVYDLYFSSHSTSLENGIGKEGSNEFVREPPTIPSPIPFFGHIFGCLFKQMNYYSQITQKYPLPIYSLGVPFSKIYVVNSPELITATQKQKTIAFEPLETQMASRLFSPSTHGQKAMTSGTNAAKGERGLYLDGLDIFHAALLPGRALDQMNRVALKCITNSCNGLEQKDANVPIKIKLVEWLRHEVTMATTNAVYGPQNPFKDPKVESAFWDFERNIGKLLISVLPSLTTGKGYLGRETLAKAFLEYYSSGHHESGSSLVTDRFKVCMDYELSLEDTARFEIGTVLAITASTIPSAFWMLYYVFSQPDLLNSLREEVGNILQTIENDTSGSSVTRLLNITTLRSACPLLTSTFQETLRLAAKGASVRVVIEDTVISDHNSQYLLKKDCVIQIPAHVVHADSSIWGPSVADFDASRFIPNTNKSQVDSQGNKKKKVPPGALRPFGGGRNLCPGRHFAATEIVALVAMILMRYDLKVIDTSDGISDSYGDWKMSKSENSSLAAVIREPDDDTEVEIVCRKEFENSRWTFQLDDSDLPFAIDGKNETW